MSRNTSFSLILCTQHPVMKLLLSGFFFISALATYALLDKRWDDERLIEWTTVKSDLYTFQVPGFMYEMSDLNSEATSSFGYVAEKQTGGGVLEMYCIVIQETHKEIKSYELEEEFNVNSYSDVCISNITSALTNYTVSERKDEVINKMNAVTTMIIGSHETVEVYYHLGVFHGKKAFYQVLTWTIVDQRNQFSGPMNQILRSFKEN